ncbi:signal peptidase complex subunit SPC1 Ecym_4783 [Eremothecium cymbalariae DBVPG|uniref:Signal peptidase complex subunit 1 n=1 Tax=Eremothecium cymbalariae (strain CBS 270.75 / DBVPG 7215 / KCTC 17166 / NRRL Y-17582) TaxID=931890 RepID=G8JSS3_ERECY|nr:hypothetical protein Ecym_4783 [Eremothecium cymbalariae DBVPG\
MEVLQELGWKLLFPIDFESQRYTAAISSKLIAVGTVLGCLLGYFTNCCLMTVYTFGATYILTLLIVVPAYPAYNKKRVNWVGSTSVNTKRL